MTNTSINKFRLLILVVVMIGLASLVMAHGPTLPPPPNCPPECDPWEPSWWCYLYPWACGGGGG